MSLLRISSMLALHVSLEVTIPSEADITQVTHIVWIHCAVSQVVVIQVVLIHPEVHTTDCHRQLKALWCCSSIYRVQNVCQTFLALHYFLGELHQPHSIFGSWFMHLRHPTDVFQGWEADICSMHQVSLHLPVSHSKLRPVWWELALVQSVHSCHSINRMSIMHPCGAPQMGCVEHDWWCRNVMTSNTDQMVGVNVQCTWNGVSGKIDDMVSISQAHRMVGSTQGALGMG